tara:strand:- start:849 stop:998 length:150 start_codon:yes stop_codon:yes gene_type:complete
MKSIQNYSEKSKRFFISNNRDLGAVGPLQMKKLKPDYKYDSALVSRPES